MTSLYTFGNKWSVQANKLIVRNSNLVNSNTANMDSALWNVSERRTSVGTNGSPSYYGCYDMMGNAWQWTDLYGYASPTKGTLGLFWGNYTPGFAATQTFTGSAAYWDYNASRAYMSFGVRIASLTNPDSLSYFVLVGDAGNAIDTVSNKWNNTRFGAVAYEYYINKYHVTNNEYIVFLNSVATTDTYNLYRCVLADSSLYPEAAILRTGTSGSYSYSIKTNYGNKPVTNLSWFMAARYCNWLHNGKPSGAQNSGTTETGAYTLNGIVSGNAPVKSVGARYSMPSMNEWYKAAFYKGGSTSAGYWRYATQSNSFPKSVLADEQGNGTIRPPVLSPVAAIGNNVTTTLVQDNIFNIGVSLTYANTSSSGITKIIPITTVIPTLPANFTLSNNLGKYNISTTSSRSGNIDVCFVVPSSISSGVFSKIKVFHTDASGTSDVTTTRTYGTRTVCARTTNFSDFHLVPETETVDQPIPYDLAGSIGNGFVDLSWSMSDTTDMIDYDIKYSSDNGVSWLTNVNTPDSGLSGTITSLTNNSNYIFKVASISSSGYSALSNSSSSFTPLAIAPSVPANLVVTADVSSVNLTWDVPADSGGLAITNYVVQYSSDSGSSWTSSNDPLYLFSDDIAPTRSLLVTNLSSSSDYIFRVLATNAV